MDGCMCGCRGSRYGVRVAGWPTREEWIDWLEEHQRDLEERAAELAAEIKRLREEPQATS